MFDKILTMLDECNPADLTYDFFKDEENYPDEISIDVHVKDGIFNFYENKKALIRVLYFLNEVCQKKEQYLDDGVNYYDFVIDGFTVSVGMY